MALKTNEVMVLGLGASWLPAGTSLLGWYIRSRLQMTYHRREQWDAGEAFLTTAIVERRTSGQEFLDLDKEKIQIIKASVASTESGVKST